MSISPSLMAIQLARTSDDELREKDARDVIQMMRQLESDYKWLLFKHNNVISDSITTSRSHISGENSSLKFLNKQLNEDNEEMRDLCCFLDDDRQRGKKLAKEWQKFGRYTATVMHREVKSYQLKLQELEEQQAFLIQQNDDLKQLCLSLDQELMTVSSDRDDGDGSSNTTAASEMRLEDNDADTQRFASTPVNPYNSFSNIEGDNQRIPRNVNPSDHYAVPSRASSNLISDPVYENMPMSRESRLAESLCDTSSRSLDRHCSHHTSAEAIANAVKVLDVHERVSNTSNSENMSEQEKQVVLDMCNVVWRKLGNTSQQSGSNPNLNQRDSNH